MNSYELSREWFDWCFENTSKISPSHTALYFFIIELNNRLGWKHEFGLPREMAMDAIGIRNQRTFTKIFNDLERWGFIKVKQRSKNQYSSNIIALSKNTKATTKALDKARQTHEQKEVRGIARIDKQYNPITLKQENRKISLAFDLLKKEKPSELESFLMKKKTKVEKWENLVNGFNNKVEIQISRGEIDFDSQQLMPRFRSYVDAWIENQKKYSNKEQEVQSTAPERF